jgi:hypothetical protein
VVVTTTTTMANDDIEEVVVILDTHYTMGEDFFGYGGENKNDEGEGEGEGEGEREGKGKGKGKEISNNSCSSNHGTTKFDVAKYIAQELLLASTSNYQTINSDRDQIEVVALIVLKTKGTSHHLYDENNNTVEQRLVASRNTTRERSLPDSWLQQLVVSHNKRSSRPGTMGLDDIESNDDKGYDEDNNDTENANYNNDTADYHKKFPNLTEYGINDKNDDPKSMSQRLQSIVISSSKSKSASASASASTSTSVTPTTSCETCGINKKKDKRIIKHGDFISAIVLAADTLCRRAKKGSSFATSSDHHSTDISTNTIGGGETTLQSSSSPSSPSSISSRRRKIVLLTCARHKVFVNNEYDETDNENNDAPEKLLFDLFEKLRSLNCKLEVVGLGFRHETDNSDDDDDSDSDEEEDSDVDDDSDEDEEDDEDLADIQDKNEDLLRDLVRKLGGFVIEVKGGGPVGNNSKDDYDVGRVLDHILKLKSNSNEDDTDEILIDDDDDKGINTICELHNKLVDYASSTVLTESFASESHLVTKTKKQKLSHYCDDHRSYTKEKEDDSNDAGDDGFRLTPTPLRLKGIIGTGDDDANDSNIVTPTDDDNTNSNTTNTTATNDMTIDLTNQSMPECSMDNNPKKKSDTQQLHYTNCDPEISIIEPSTIRAITDTATETGNNLNDEKEGGNNSEDDDEPQILSSNAINANIAYPHRRPECDVYAFSTTDIDGNTLQDRFCDKCYCVVCDVPAKNCTEWNDHCREVYVPRSQPDIMAEILLESPNTTRRNHFAAVAFAAASASLSNSHRRDLFSSSLTASETAGVAITRSTNRRRSSGVVGADLIVAKIREESAIEYIAPYRLKNVFRRCLVNVSADVAAQLVIDHEDCIICHCSLVVDEKANGTSQQSKKPKKRDIVVTIACGHKFHRGCILDSMTKSNLGNRCPFKCDKLIGEPQGTCPSGSMSTTRDSSRHCSGYDNNSLSAGTIIIKYHIPKSLQLEYHENPGVFQLGLSRICYLPDVHQSNQLLLRLQYAFSHGLTFKVDKSNQIRTTIPHKTSMTDEFIDFNYFEECNQFLENLRVPQTEDLPKESDGDDVLEMDDDIRLPWGKEAVNKDHRRKFH